MKWKFDIFHMGFLREVRIGLFSGYKYEFKGSFTINIISQIFTLNW